MAKCGTLVPTLGSPNAKQTSDRRASLKPMDTQEP